MDKCLFIRILAVQTLPACADVLVQQRQRRQQCHQHGINVRWMVTVIIIEPVVHTLVRQFVLPTLVAAVAVAALVFQASIVSGHNQKNYHDKLDKTSSFAS